MSDNTIKGWLKGQEVMDQWGLLPAELLECVKNGLPVYDPDYTLRYYTVDESELERESSKSSVLDEAYNRPLAEWEVILPNIEKCYFKADEFEDFRRRFKLPRKEKSEGEKEGALTAKKARKYGQLKREKEKWDESIKAAVRAALFCSKQDNQVTRDQLWKELSKKNFGKIPDTTFEKIWKAIPEKYRNRGGRPKGKSDS